MKRIGFIFFVFVGLFQFDMFAQSIRGHVYDAADSTPIPFAMVYLVEADKGMMTDSLGAFEISTPE
jgi:hypothetical protein